MEGESQRSSGKACDGATVEGRRARRRRRLGGPCGRNDAQEVGGERPAAEEVPAQSHPGRGVRALVHGAGAGRSEGAAGEDDQQFSCQAMMKLGSLY